MEMSLNCQKSHSFHKMNYLKHISHYTVCLCAVWPIGFIATDGAETKIEKQPLGVLQQKEEEHLCALMLMMSEYMEKRASEGKEVKGWSCWQALNVQLPHITLRVLNILSARRMWSFFSVPSALEMK